MTTRGTKQIALDKRAPKPEVAPSLSIEQVRDEVRRLTEAQERMSHLAYAPATVAMYECHWRLFGAWCARMRLPEPVPPVDPNMVLAYMVSLGELGKSISTLRMASAAISHRHAERDMPSPCRTLKIRRHLRALTRTRAIDGTHPVKKAASLRPEDMEAIVAHDDRRSDAIVSRDRALLLLGFAGGFRRSELVRLRVGDVVDTGTGLVVTVRRSKGDQEGKGALVTIPRARNPALCPWAALRTYLATVSPTGPLFCHVRHNGAAVRGTPLPPRTVAKIIREAVRAMGGKDPAIYSGHSLRRGFINTAFRAGLLLDHVQRHVRHKRSDTTRGYLDNDEQAQDPERSPVKGVF